MCCLTCDHPRGPLLIVNSHVCFPLCSEMRSSKIDIESSYATMILVKDSEIRDALGTQDIYFHLRHVVLYSQL